jgi:predicted nuclease of predicted toxin-antitoxin system
LKLLFDANLSPKLVPRLAELFPGSVHVFETGLARFTRDESVWTYARENGFAIVTADADFVQLVEKRGAPPKIIRLEKCDYRTRVVEALLRSNAVRIAELEGSDRELLIIRNAK